MQHRYSLTAALKQAEWCKSYGELGAGKRWQGRDYGIRTINWARQKTELEETDELCLQVDVWVWGRGKEAVTPQLDPCTHTSMPGGLLCTKPVGPSPGSHSRSLGYVQVAIRNLHGCVLHKVSCPNWWIKVHFSNRADQAETKILSFPMPVKKRMHTAKNKLHRTEETGQGEKLGFFADFSSFSLV